MYAWSMSAELCAIEVRSKPSRSFRVIVLVMPAQAIRWDADGVAAVLELETLVPDFRLVARHVFFGEDAAVCLNVGGDRPGDVALVEGVGSALAYCFEDVGEFGLLENRAVNDIAHRHVAAGPEYTAEFVVSGDHP